MLEPLTFLGLGAVAVWLYVRYPRLRPRTLVRATIHVAVSFTLFSLVPQGLRLCSLLPPRASLVVFLTTMLLPGLLYVLVSWIWLVARLLELGNSTPRGGHPVTAPGR